MNNLISLYLSSLKDLKEKELSSVNTEIKSTAEKTVKLQMELDDSKTKLNVLKRKRETMENSSILDIVKQLANKLEDAKQEFVVQKKQKYDDDTIPDIEKETCDDEYCDDDECINRRKRCFLDYSDTDEDVIEADNNKKDSWNEDEDNMLLKLCAQGKDWQKISKKLKKKGYNRSSDACRMRFNRLKKN